MTNSPSLRLRGQMQSEETCHEAPMARTVPLYSLVLSSEALVAACDRDASVHTRQSSHCVLILLTPNPCAHRSGEFMRSFVSSRAQFLLCLLIVLASVGAQAQKI